MHGKYFADVHWSGKLLRYFDKCVYTRSVRRTIDFRKVQSVIVQLAKSVYTLIEGRTIDFWNIQRLNLHSIWLNGIYSYCKTFYRFLKQILAFYKTRDDKSKFT